MVQGISESTVAFPSFPVDLPDRLEISRDFALLHRWPTSKDFAVAEAPLAICFRWAGESSTIYIAAAQELDELGSIEASGTIFTLLVDRRALERLGGSELADDSGASYFLPQSLRHIMLNCRECELLGDGRIAYITAKSVELLCELIRLSARGMLTPRTSNGELSMAGTQRLMAARRLIDDNCHEKLTLDSIARSCGMSRSTLSQGFRAMFGCSVAEALAERRLGQARQMLLTTDLMISSIGYRAGYLNNASFTRAFARRFGLSPSDLRATQLAA